MSDTTLVVGVEEAQAFDFIVEELDAHRIFFRQRKDIKYASPATEGALFDNNRCELVPHARPGSDQGI